MRSTILFSVLVMGLMLFSCSDNNMLTDPGSSAVNDESQQLDTNPANTSETIVDIAMGNEDFSILVEAVVFAGLTEALSGKRQMTVFAPTNEAFVNALDYLGLEADELFMDGNQDLVREILLYHVAPGRRYAEDVVSSERIRTVSKGFAVVKIDDGKAMIGNDIYGFAEIVDTDIEASNGVIHVLNAVMLPPGLKSTDEGYVIEKDPRGRNNPTGDSIVDLALSKSNFSILVEAILFADLTETLKGNRQFTVFAPTNQAFVDLLKKLDITKEQLFAEGNEDLVEKILLYHVAPGERFAEDVVSSDQIRTMAEEFAMIKLEDGMALIGNDKYGYAQITDTDLDVRNGVVHVINAVIVPPSLEL